MGAAVSTDEAEPDGSVRRLLVEHSEVQASLLSASMKGDAPEVQELLHQRAEVNFRYEDGLTALHFAALFDRAGAAAALLAAGADPAARSTDEVEATPLQLATVQGHKDVLHVLKGAVRQSPRQGRLFSGNHVVLLQTLRKRYSGPLAVALLIGSVAGLAWALLDPRLRWEGWREPEEGADAAGDAELQRALVVGAACFCLLCLVLVNTLDPGSVEKEEVAYVEELFARDDGRKVVADAEHFGYIRDDGEVDVFAWCSSCKFWRPKNVSHCSSCRRCFWRFDHHCRAVGTCIAARNHVVFAVLLLSGAGSWLFAATSVLLHFQAHGANLAWTAWRGAGLKDWPLLLALPYVAAGLFMSAFLTLFGGFHASALCFNYNTKMMLRPKSAEARCKCNSAEVYWQLFCSPLRFRSCCAPGVSSWWDAMLGARCVGMVPPASTSVCLVGGLAPEEEAGSTSGGSSSESDGDGGSAAAAGPLP